MNTKPSSMVSSMAVKVSYLSAVFQRLWSLGDAGSLSGLLKLSMRPSFSNDAGAALEECIACSRGIPRLAGDASVGFKRADSSRAKLSTKVDFSIRRVLGEGSDHKLQRACPLQSETRSSDRFRLALSSGSTPQARPGWAAGCRSMVAAFRPCVLEHSKRRQGPSQWQLSTHCSH